MPRFVANPVIVSCERFTGTIDQWPESFRLAVRRHLAGGITEIMTGDGVRPVRYGDWVVHGPDGLFTVWHESQFETFFAPVLFAEASPGSEPVKSRRK